MRYLAACLAAVAIAAYTSGCCCCGPGVPNTTGGTVSAPLTPMGSALPKLEPTIALAASTSNTQRF